MTMHTNRDAIDFITQAIEAAGSDVAKPSEYDIDAIARDLHGKTGSWDLATVEHDVFWTAVERHAKTWVSDVVGNAYLYDADDASLIGDATAEQIQASAGDGGETGIILIDGVGDVISEQDVNESWVPQPVRRVYVS